MLISPKIKVFIVEDHTIVRQGLISLLSLQPEFELVGEAGDGLSALDLIPKVQPDIVICDLALPGLGGLELMERILRPKRRGASTIQKDQKDQKDQRNSSVKQTFEDIFEEEEIQAIDGKSKEKVPVFKGKFIILSMYHDAQWVQKALNAGAWGYLLKGSGVQDLSLAIKSVHQGQCFLSAGAERATEVEALTPREEEVLILVAQGHSSKEMSGILNISSRTVEHHRARLMEKLKIYDVAGLTRYAIRMGLVDVNFL
jgi:DNA-binding NarL/FixJ family response regulator